MRGSLDIYRHILGPHAERIEEQVEPLVKKMLHRDRDWFRKQRARLGNPFAELEQIVVAAQKRQLEYASRRVALAAAREELAAKKGIEPAAGGLETKDEMLEDYRAKFGERDAKLIATKANHHRQFVKQQPERLEERARRFAAPHPPRSELDQKIGDWVRENRGPATALLALERAEQRTAELERAEFEAAEVEPAAAPPEPGEPGLEEGAIEWLSGPEINQQIERRKEELVPEYERMSRRELTDSVTELETELHDRGREIYDEAARLEEARAPLFAPPEQLIRQASDAEQGAREASDPMAQRELKAKADYFRQQVREDRRWRDGIEDVQGRWVDLHAKEAALVHVSERGLDRARAAEAEAEGIGF